jgi:hypothetical protein
MILTNLFLSGRTALKPEEYLEVSNRYNNPKKREREREKERDNGVLLNPRCDTCV